jgi:hypothetical protein
MLDSIEEGEASNIIWDSQKIEESPIYKLMSRKFG